MARRRKDIWAPLRKETQTRLESARKVLREWRKVDNLWYEAFQRTLRGEKHHYASLYHVLNGIPSTNIKSHREYLEDLRVLEPKFMEEYQGLLVMEEKIKSSGLILAQFPLWNELQTLIGAYTAEIQKTEIVRDQDKGN